MEHYHRHLSIDTLLERLRNAYPQGADAWQLAPVDQLHTGGIRASLSLCERVQRLGSRCILDIGAGSGGLLHLLAQLPDTRVVGIDLCHAYNRLNRGLGDIRRQSRAPALCTGDAAALPFADQAFDTLVMQHSLLNMPDSAGVLRECARVLEPGGHLLLHELVQGRSPGPLHYPVPWADSPRDSHLEDSSRLQQRLLCAGFEIIECRDLTANTLDWRQRQQTKERDPARAAKAPVSPRWILGPDFPQRADNLLRNLCDGRVAAIELLARLPA
ncbi:type 11 methyltransferase [Marinobacterium nitratireducens]|uniref:Type 11 methyltransferase n=1 Tax=Marinobacterium nitratireducens TaxID=518897 RepID=A0A917ZG24_9GAMM|nr:class I SAM-dependent methyltransferase [Marinobacterium nitratireducens]GGO81309.1 type 11 methyltransferase [Marinobacterium nitratireducens]